MTDTKKSVGLPVSVVGPVDLGRLLRELQSIDEQLRQDALRHQAAPQPKMSQLLADMVDLNHVDILQSSQREQLLHTLESLRQHAPRLHMSLAADPSTDFSAKLTQWLRQHIHPQLLLTFGLQPSIAAGCMVRTTNKHFDFSLGKSLISKQSMLLDLLQASVAKAAANDPAAIEAAALAAASAKLLEDKA